MRKAGRVLLILLFAVIGAREMSASNPTCKTCYRNLDYTTTDKTGVTVYQETCADMQYGWDQGEGRMTCSETHTNAEVIYWVFRYDIPRCASLECSRTGPEGDTPWCQYNCYEQRRYAYTQKTCALSGSPCVPYQPPPEDEGPTSPIVRKYANGPWRFSDVAGGVPFDMAGDSVTRRWSWPESGIELLVFDRSDASGFGPPDGKINSGAELFGDAPLYVGAERPANGFEKLAKFDENGDGWIDGRDPIFAKLLFWRDEAPRDGVSQPHELASIASRGVEAISLDFHKTQRHDMNGNSFRFIAHMKVDGKTEPVYDVFLKHD